MRTERTPTPRILGAIVALASTVLVVSGSEPRAHATADSPVPARGAIGCAVDAKLRFDNQFNAVGSGSAVCNGRRNKLKLTVTIEGTLSPPESKTERRRRASRIAVGQFKTGCHPGEGWWGVAILELGNGTKKRDRTRLKEC
jgi:hypothetical protein